MHDSTIITIVKKYYNSEMIKRWAAAEKWEESK